MIHVQYKLEVPESGEPFNPQKPTTGILLTMIKLALLSILAALVMSVHPATATAPTPDVCCISVPGGCSRVSGQPRTWNPRAYIESNGLFTREEGICCCMGSGTDCSRCDGV